jgi:hypothetical protein
VFGPTYTHARRERADALALMRPKAIPSLCHGSQRIGLRWAKRHDQAMLVRRARRGLPSKAPGCVNAVTHAAEHSVVYCIGPSHRSFVKLCAYAANKSVAETTTGP